MLKMLTGPSQHVFGSVAGYMNLLKRPGLRILHGISVHVMMSHYASGCFVSAHRSPCFDN